MSLVYAVWEGSAGRDPAETLVRLREEHRGQAPTPAIREYVERLLVDWPCITTRYGGSSPWSDGPQMRNATGGVYVFGVQAAHSAMPELMMEAADQAAARGLVLYDLQLGEVVEPL